MLFDLQPYRASCMHWELVEVILRILVVAVLPMAKQRYETFPLVCYLSLCFVLNSLIY